MKKGSAEEKARKAASKQDRDKRKEASRLALQDPYGPKSHSTVLRIYSSSVSEGAFLAETSEEALSPRGSCVYAYLYHSLSRPFGYPQRPR